MVKGTGWRSCSKHRLIVEKVLGKPIPMNACVHHVNEIRSDNSNKNLVLCEDNSYHRLLHVRLKRLKLSGNINSEQCRACRMWDNPENLLKRVGFYVHSSCRKKSAGHLGQATNSYPEWLEILRNIWFQGT